MLPTIADVLALAEVAAGRPRVVAGADRLDRSVRWVHVAPVTGTRRLLLGGELLLTTGVGLAQDAGELEAYVDDLVAADVAGLVLELGDRFSESPPALIERCQRAGLPLVVLDREVRFVSITQAVHGLIIDGQSQALRERDHVHEVFAELNRRGRSVRFLLDQVARMIGSAVVLEDLNHRALAWSSFGRDPGSYLHEWAPRSRRAAQQASPRPAPYERTTYWSSGGWLRTPVEALGQQWGHLVAVDCDEVPATGEVVLENAALALSLARLAGRDEWTRTGHLELIDGLVAGEFVGLDDVRAAFESTGFRTRRRVLTAVAIRSEDAADRVAAASAAAPGVDVDVVAAPWAQSPRDTALFLCSSKADSRAGAGSAHGDRLVSLLAPGDPEAYTLVAVGPDASEFADLGASADAAIGLLQSLPARGPAGVHVHHTKRAALALLLYGRRSDPALQEFVERVLGPLLAYDAEHGGDLVAVARAYVDHPTNRKRAAAACHLSRSVFYQRLETIERLLDIDLRDGEAVGTLHAALVAHGQR
ncbi:PucR family transcriptional regulator [Solicola gregarius]|uniref:PucR family transcriptional regulator n=1 Tax=Solicola gregarius TaxID=2908642 RepID=A0AA46TFD9_9ACTN|nr:PucR family transcriptional regulator [Solicola gregarius]UYM03563.1 PucR family transcriptional regulator [Solicola gregarius]